MVWNRTNKQSEQQKTDKHAVQWVTKGKITTPRSRQHFLSNTFSLKYAAVFVV